MTNRRFHNTGVDQAGPSPDRGRGTHLADEQCGLKRDKSCEGAFVTPTLIDIAHTAPYFHDGSAKTLEEAVAVMLAGGGG